MTAGRRRWLLIVIVLLAAGLACNAPAGDALMVFGKAALQDCESADRLRYESALRHIGGEPETPANPETARYEVCYSRWSGEPQSARMIEGETGDLARFDGTYLGTEIERPEMGAITEVLDTVVTVEVVEGELVGEIVDTSLVQSAGGDERPYTKTEQAVQTILLEATVRPSGAFVGRGTTSVVYTLLSCEPEENCEGVGATISRAVGAAVSLEGTIIEDTLVGEVVNSVSGARLDFEAKRTGP